MKEKQTVKKNLAQAKSIRQRCRTSCIQLQNFLFYQENTLQKRSILAPCAMCISHKSQTKKQFRRAFKSLSKLEQSEYYLMNLRNVQQYMSLYSRNVGQESKIIEQKKQKLSKNQKNTIKMQFQFKDNKIYKKFEVVSCQIFPEQKIMKIQGFRYEIDLHYYLIRKSKGIGKNCIVLQSMQPFNQIQSVRLIFSQIDYDDCYNIVRKIWQNAQYDNIKKFLIQSNKFPRKIYHKNLSSSSLPKNLTEPNQQYIQLFSSQNRNQKSQQKRQQSPISRLESINGHKLPSKNRAQFYNQMKYSLDNFTNFTKVQQDLTKKIWIYHNIDGQKVRKKYMFDYSKNNLLSIMKQIDDLKQIKTRKPTLEQIKKISQIPTEHTSIYKQIDLLLNVEVQFVYLRHMIKKQDQNGNLSEVFYFEKSVNLEELADEKNSKDTKKGIINYCIWRIKKLANLIQVIVQASIKYDKQFKNAQNMTSAYIGQIYLNNNQKIQNKNDNNTNNKILNMDIQSDQQISIQTHQFQNYYLQEISVEYNENSQEFYTVNGSLSSQHVLDQIHAIQQDQQQLQSNFMDNFKKKNNQQNFQKFTQEISTNKQTKQTNQLYTPYDYLKHQFQLKPKKKTLPIQMRQPKGHTVFGTEWKITDAGELINLDLEKIKKQSSVLKLVLKRMGKNLLAGKSILNMSLPIEIFATQSNIERIARGYAYAPVFLQKAAIATDPIQRMKYVFCFGLGYSIAYIMMQKPFNPVLGETYQGQVDGCPVYGEQISHHPPICSMLFIGRGYRVYGNFQSKVHMGMNSASGINEGFNYIQFDDKSTVRINGPPGQINGVIIGQRKLGFKQKSYYIDEKNLIFCQISWGKQSNSSRPQSKYNDFFSGKVVKLKNGVNLNNYTKIKSKDIEKYYGQIYGRYTGQVYFQYDQIFDVNQTAPYLIEYYQPCLQSDSRNRKDIIERKNNNLQKAQDAKQEIQELQRNDRKLRKDK